MVITALYAPSFTALPQAASLERAFAQAAAVFTNALYNQITVNVQVGWGEVAGQKLPAGAVAASTAPVYGPYAYANVRNALAASASTTNDRIAVAALPLSAPAGQATYVVPAAEAKALGLLAGNLSTIDGYIGFSGSPTDFAYDPAHATQIPSNAYDFIGVAEHELAEILGRTSGTNYPTLPWRTPLDLFRCSAGGLSFSFTALAAFSIDGCHTNLKNYNVLSTADRSDWAPQNASSDASDAFIGRGRYKTVSSIDYQLLDVLGYGVTISVPPASSRVKSSNITGRAPGRAAAVDVDEPGSGLVVGMAVAGLILRGRGRRPGRTSYSGRGRGIGLRFWECDGMEQLREAMWPSQRHF